MYKVTVNTSGKYHNVALGARYCLTRKSAINLANFFLEVECDITIEKFIHCHNCFAWSDAWEETHIFIEEDDDCNPIRARKTNRHDF
jgi:hypothetical protein